MKQYTGQLEPTTKKLISQYKDRLEMLLSGRLGKVASNGKVYTLDESLEKYNYGLTQEEIKAWVWYRRKQGVPMLNWKQYFTNPSDTELKSWVTNTNLFYDKGNLVPYPIFIFGNIYKKISATIADKDAIVSAFGISVYQSHIDKLESKKPKALSVSNPVVGERPVVLAISEFAQTFMVASIKDIEFKEPESLQEAYKDWLRVQPDFLFKKVRPMEITNIYLNNDRKPGYIDKVEWNAKKKQTRDEGENLFKVFLHEAIEYKDQVRLDLYFNENFNAYCKLETHKIPVALEVSKKFKGFDLSLSPAQAEGVAFIELVGSGIIAYDVGVGKTITAIINIINALNAGKCSRPLIVVPNPTYKNWLLEILGNKELEGILSNTDVTLNTWYNLGVGTKINLKEKVKERSITVVTYEGFQKMGFNQSTAADHLNELSDVLSQTDESERNQEKTFEKFREMIGIGNKGTVADIETLGFDFLVIDEAHNFKNVFSEVKSEKKQAKQFHISGGSPSTRGIKAFFVCNYIQRTFGRNVILLTATPFTNSPLEIYSMLSLVALDYMKEMGIYNIRYFFEQFIQETSEFGVKQNGEIEYKDVVKSFNNRVSLQQLVFSHISFKTGEDADVPRPCKINLPKTTVITETGVERLDKDKQTLTYLNQNEMQKDNQKVINEKASEPVNKDDAGKLLSLMSESLNNAFSPFLVGRAPRSYVSFLEETPTDYKDFVENSPKIFYTVECIRSVKKWHESRNESVSGQVIYSDRGKDFFPFIKQYLEKEVGFKKGISLIEEPRQKVDEVEIISSGMSQDIKEKIKQAFNEGTCKVIIGTSTIKEGINLQEKSTCLYNLLPDWNPTGIKQLEGRIWRQKNMFQFVRIVMPLMENSMDIFIFQKLEEKTARINELFSRADGKNVLDEESLDPNEVKFALVTDLGVLLRFELKQISSELITKEIILKSNIEDLENYVVYKDRLEVQDKKLHELTVGYKASFGANSMFPSENGNVYFDDVIKLGDLEKLTKEKQSIILRFQKVFNALNYLGDNYQPKDAIKTLRMYNSLINTYQLGTTIDVYAENVSKFTKIKRTVFEQRGYSESTDLSVIKSELENELLLVQAEQVQIKTPDFQDQLMVKIAEQKKLYAVKGGSLEDRVKDFAALNHIMSYHFDINKKFCDIPQFAAPKIKAEKPIVNIDDRSRRLKLAKAKAKAILINLKLAS
jgi:superfamily II DNA or RNA helicase